jgi:hypothetical protein
MTALKHLSLRLPDFCECVIVNVHDLVGIRKSSIHDVCDIFTVSGDTFILPPVPLRGEVAICFGMAGDMASILAQQISGEQILRITSTARPQRYREH